MAMGSVQLYGGSHGGGSAACAFTSTGLFFGVPQASRAVSPSAWVTFQIMESTRCLLPGQTTGCGRL